MAMFVLMCDSNKKRNSWIFITLVVVTVVEISMANPLF
jgi:hypothetical protein